MEILDVNAYLPLDVTDKISPYFKKLNREVMESSFDQVFYIPKLSEAHFQNATQYPESFVCQE